MDPSTRDSDDSLNLAEELDQKGLNVLRLMYEDPWASKHAIARKYMECHGGGKKGWSDAAKARFEKIRERLLIPRLSASKALLDSMVIRFLTVKLHNNSWNNIKLYMEEINKIPYVQDYYVLNSRQLDFLIKIVAPNIQEFNRVHAVLRDSNLSHPATQEYDVKQQFYSGNHELSYLTEQYGFSTHMDVPPI